MPKKKKQTTRKKSAKKTTPKRKAGKEARAASKQSLARKRVKFSAKRKRVTSTGLVVETVPLSSAERQEQRDGQAGDLQALSDRPTSNSGSVEEFQGNALEAEAVQSVENGLDANQGQVEHELPEDDVPQEYLDKDR